MATILVVDDNPINRKVLVALLSSDGHLTLEATDGLDGLQTAQARRPELIISDILMPTMDGFAFVRALREDPVLRGTPVIFYTAQYHEREAHKLALTCGVARVLVKPCPHGELLKAVDQVMAGVSESEPPPLPETFDREHLRVVTNKLSERATALAASNARFTALAELTLQIASERDSHELLERACAGARNLVGSLYAILSVAQRADAGGGAFCVTSGIDFNSRVPPPPDLEAGPLGAVLRTRKPWRTCVSDIDHRDAGFPSGYPQARAFLGVPIMSPTQVYGWFCLGEKVGADCFEPEDEMLLSVLGAQVGRAFENIALHIELERRSSEAPAEHSSDIPQSALDHLDRAYTLSSRIALTISRAQGREELCREICRLLLERGGVRLAYIEMLDMVTGKLTTVASAGNAVDINRLIHKNTSEPSNPLDLLSLALNGGRAMISNNLQDSPQPVYLRQEMLELGYRAIAVLPLRASGMTLGRMVLLTDLESFFDPPEVQLMTKLASSVSIALAHTAQADLDEEADAGSVFRSAGLA